MQPDPTPAAIPVPHSLSVSFGAAPTAVSGVLAEWENSFDVIGETERRRRADEAAQLVAIENSRRALERIQRMHPDEMRFTGATKFQSDDLAQRSLRLQVGLALSIHEITAGRLIDCAQVLVNEFTRTLASLEEGRIRLRHAQTMVETAATLPVEQRLKFEAIAVKKAELLSPTQFDKAARKIAATLHPETLEERHATAFEDRSAFLQPAADAMATYTIENSAVAIYGIQDRVEKIARALRAEPDETRTLAQLRSDVLTRILLEGDIYPDYLDYLDDSDARTAESSDTNPAPRSPKKPGLGRYCAFTPSVHITVPVLSILGRTQEPASLDGYGPIPMSQAIELAAVAPSFTRILTHPETGAVLSVGRDSYRVPKDLARWIRTRDGVCRWPTCDRPAKNCDLDHTIPWTPARWRPEGGETSADNLESLCTGHHVPRHGLMINGWGVPIAEAWGITHEKDTNGHTTGVIIWTTPTGHTYRSEPDLIMEPYRPPQKAGQDPDPPDDAPEYNGRPF